MITKRQLQVLRLMRDNDQDFVYERGRSGYVGLERVSKETMLALIRLMAVRLDPYSVIGVFERYTINETGRKICEDLL